MIVIDSVTDFIKEVSELNIDGNVYFRGQSNYTYELVPGIYRKEDGDFTHLNNEQLMYRDVISKSPTEFINKNTLESLTLMQHYGLPTRILDVTSNALVALYFACKGNYGNKGKVYVFDVEYESIVNYNSDKACILSNLCKLNSDFIYLTEYYQEVKAYKDKISEKIFDNNYEYIGIGDDYVYIQEHVFQTEFFKNDRNVSYYLTDGLITTIKNLIEEDISQRYTDIDPLEHNIQIIIMYKIYTDLKVKLDDILENILINVNKQFFGNLIDFIREDKAHFDPRIEPSDVGRILLVKPKLDNARIVRQQGAFFLYGIDANRYNKPIPDFNKNWISKEIIIDHNAKESILTDLEMLGINEISLFPEIDYVAKYIKNKYTV